MSQDENFGSKRKIEKKMDAITIKLKKMLLSRNVVMQVRRHEIHNIYV